MKAVFLFAIVLFLLVLFFGCLDRMHAVRRSGEPEAQEREAHGAEAEKGGSVGAGGGTGGWVGVRGSGLGRFGPLGQRPAAHGLALFVACNLVAMAIAVACLSFSRYGLDLHSPLADNVANMAGIGLGALFRFWAYREFVFAGAEVLETTQLS